VTLDAARVATLSSEEQAEALLPLVASVADSYGRRNRRLDRGELLSEAHLGLVEALQTFDPSKGQLPAYVVAKVRFRLSDYHRNNERAVMKTPRGVVPRRVGLEVIKDSRSRTVITEKDELSSLRVHLQELPEADRSVLSAILKGTSRSEIAKECGVTLSAIDHRYLQAVKKLRLLMGVSK
jgi:RNA polymerase sigma factor (sigma-70 family)